MRRILLISCLMLLASPFWGDQKNDTASIDQLITNFSKAALQPGDMAQFIAADTPAEIRDSSLKQIHKPYETFVVLRKGDISFRSENEAEATLESHRATPSSDTKVTRIARFRKVNGRWYFADFDFLKFPWVLFGGIAGAGFLLGIGVLVLYLRLRKRQQPIPV